MAINQGLYGRVFVAEHSDFTVAPAISGSNALRHTLIKMTFDRFNFQDSKDRSRTPDRKRQSKREAKASIEIDGKLWPSGTIGTSPEADLLLKNAFGTAARTPALSTTVASAPSTTGATLTSSTGLAVGDWVLINVATDQLRARQILTLNGGTHAVTWAPALPVAPTAGDTVKTGVIYVPGTDIPSKLYAAHYLQSFNRECLGFGADGLELTFQQAEEPMFKMTGPAAFVNRTDMQAEPGSFTTVGTAIPTGMQAYVMAGDAVIRVKKLTLSIKNNYVPRMGEMGYDRATDLYRNNFREITLQVDQFVEDPAPIYANAESGTPVAIFLQCGTVEGQIWAFYAPINSFDVADTDDGDSELSWSHKAEMLGSLGNDELSLAQL